MGSPASRIQRLTAVGNQINHIDIYRIPPDAKTVWPNSGEVNEVWWLPWSSKPVIRFPSTSATHPDVALDLRGTFLQVPCDPDHVKLASKENTLMVSASTDGATNPVEIMVTKKVHLRLTNYADHAG